jgi:hypothetical protein
MNSRNQSSTMKRYTLADIQALRERQPHRSRSIYSDMRSISEDAFRNALENDALPIIEQLLEVIEKQHAALVKINPHISYVDLGGTMNSAIALAEPWIEKYQQRLRREEGEQKSR